ncbi:hypothetical protein A2U01_0022714, partial [Trifolium medium]|nr:hypothetical protein [Trifolium medium]
MEDKPVENKQDQFMVNGSNEIKDLNAARSKTNSKKKESISETTYEHLECVIDDDPLGFENGWSDEVGKLEAQDPLEEVNLAEEGREDTSQAKSETVHTGGGGEDQSRDRKVAQRLVHPNSQIFIAEEDVPKTAFKCPGTIGTFEWTVMTFGLKNA